MQNESILRLTSVDKSYPLGRVLVRALSRVDLEIARGEFTALTGPSGSGKTTLLNLIGCIDKPDTGTIELAGADVTDTPLHKLTHLRRDLLGYIFQTFNLVPVLTAWENVEYPLRLRNVPKRERRERVGQWLEEVGLLAQAKQRPDQLSGGQRQRVAIARAMVGEPQLVVADEPTANLDSDTATHILDLLSTINERTGTTFVFSTHDPALVSRARRVVAMRDGRIAAELAAGGWQSAVEPPRHRAAV
jgi:putative ABC transport system ATP-binding protein